jgi:hypothetical protein
MSSYALGLRCECGARRSDGSRRWCAQCRYANATGESGGVEVATSPWWRDADGVLARVRGDATVVREIIRGLEPDPALSEEANRANRPFVFLVDTGT